MKYTEDENGYITIPNNPISKSGVFQYLGSSISPELDPETVYNVWRPEEELNNPDTIESFRLTPWIPEHIMLGTGFTPAEVVGVQGVTGETVEFNNGTLYSKLKLFGEDLKKLIRAGLKELSCGFRCAWEIKSGMTPTGERYDVIQRQIRGNHLASVEQARMGSDVRVAMDKAVFALDSLDFNPKPNGETMTLEEAMAKIAELESKLSDKSKAEDADEEEEKTTKAEDMTEEEKALDADAEEEKDKEKSGAMDAAIKAIKVLTAKVTKLESTAMDGNAMMKAFTAKQELAKHASAIVGAFDHSDMDANGVAKYALKKMGHACDAGLELATFKGFLLASKAPTFTVDNGHAKDGADVTKSETLDKAGL
ncbi:hypothetical protein S141_33 [Shewanella sp. phage 1/41]|uniref:head maturation protease n=1 Tax=Shewanella sp. phage 1/41 TaxID=1458861 RepID=UPI0004F7B097|nr:head maturation protease [Shewanella sp. phage 1/41]AHK11679.1 hypothetical protein S141_33 [Shewanella sp. phage 1/41]